MRRKFMCLMGAALLIGSISGAAAQAGPQNPGCETIPDRQRRIACFEQAGIPVINCDRPRDADENAFCRGIEACRQSRPAQPADTPAWSAAAGNAPPQAPAPAQWPSEAYRRISFEDFLLDGKNLAAGEAKVAISGIYYKDGEIEFLFPSSMAVIMAKNTLKMDTAVPLLTNDALRDFRKGLLYCHNMVLGCAVTVVGHVTTCEKTDLVGTTSLPCLTAEDGRMIQRR